MRFRLEDAVHSNLAPGVEERYQLDGHALPRLAWLFRAVAGGVTAEREFQRMVQLAMALEGELASPTAAARLWTLLAVAPEVLARLRRRLGRASAIDHTRQFLRREGREMVLRAPSAPGPWKKGHRPALSQGGGQA